MTNEEASRRIAELEEALRRERREKEMYKATVFTFWEQAIPDEPLTEEELHRMLTDTTGTPIRQIIAELKLLNA